MALNGFTHPIGHVAAGAAARRRQRRPTRSPAVSKGLPLEESTDKIPEGIGELPDDVMSISKVIGGRHHRVDRIPYGTKQTISGPDGVETVETITEEGGRVITTTTTGNTVTSKIVCSDGWTVTETFIDGQLTQTEVNGTVILPHEWTTRMRKKVAEVLGREVET